MLCGRRGSRVHPDIASRKRWSQDNCPEQWLEKLLQLHPWHLQNHKLSQSSQTLTNQQSHTVTRDELQSSYPTPSTLLNDMVLSVNQFCVITPIPPAPKTETLIYAPVSNDSPKSTSCFDTFGITKASMMVSTMDVWKHLRTWAQSFRMSHEETP